MIRYFISWLFTCRLGTKDDYIGKLQEIAANAAGLLMLFGLFGLALTSIFSVVSLLAPAPETFPGWILVVGFAHIGFWLLVGLKAFICVK